MNRPQPTPKRAVAKKCGRLTTGVTRILQHAPFPHHGWHQTKRTRTRTLSSWSSRRLDRYAHPKRPANAPPVMTSDTARSFSANCFFPSYLTVSAGAGACASLVFIERRAARAAPGDTTNASAAIVAAAHCRHGRPSAARPTRHGATSGKAGGRMGLSPPPAGPTDNTVAVDLRRVIAGPVTGRSRTRPMSRQPRKCDAVAAVVHVGGAAGHAWVAPLSAETAGTTVNPRRAMVNNRHERDGAAAGGWDGSS